MANGNGQKTEMEKEKEVRSGKIVAFKRFTTKQYHFWTLVYDHRRTQSAAWKTINPNSKASDETVAVKASEMMRKIRAKILSDDEWLEALDLGPSRIFRVHDEGMKAEKFEIRGDRAVRLPDYAERRQSANAMSDILGLKKLRVEVEGDVKVRHDTTPGFTNLVEDVIDEINNGNGRNRKPKKTT